MKVGILGGGQLARMLALAAHPLGIETLAYDPNADAGAKHVTAMINGTFQDNKTLQDFRQQVDCATFETENIPQETAAFVGDACTLYPNLQALITTQDRLLEKNFFHSHNIQTAPYVAIETKAELIAACKTLGFPALLKTRREGYDGKGQILLKTEADIDQLSLEQANHFILEGFVNFQREVSIIAVRSKNNDYAFYPISENKHEHGILRWSHVLTHEATLQKKAETTAKIILEALDYVGVLAIEFFQVGDQLIANEMAPRVHNTGHWTIEGAYTSQFENHLRAISGLPLGITDARGPCIMINCLGAMPSLDSICHIPYAHYHHYHKSPRSHRKVGHITLCTPDKESLTAYATKIMKLLPST